MPEEPPWPGSVAGSLPIAYRYTAGTAGERFFRALAEQGIFLATRCAACSVVYCPPVAFCERCLAALDPDDAFPVGPAGVLESFTVVHVGLDGRPLPVPVVVGLVRLDGASTCLVHRLAADGAPLRIGQPVRAILKDPEQRRGGLDDLLHFVAG